MASKSIAFGIAALFSTAAFGSDDYVLPSSCNDLEDGEHKLKLLDGDVEDAPIVTLECSNGYIILDPSKDSNLESYFNTYMKFHHSVAGPTNDVHTNWEGWYLGDDGSSQYVISPDCNTCEDDHKRQIHSNSDGLTKTAYMMTGTMFGCFWNLKGEHNFDEDYDSYQCYYNSGSINEIGESIRNELGDDSTEDEWNESGVCAFSVRESNQKTKSEVSHDACTVDWLSLNSNGYGRYANKDVYHLKPSIGTNGQYCVCTKPSTTNYYSVSKDEMKSYITAREVELDTEINENKNTNSDNSMNKISDSIKTMEEIESVTKLYQSDFEKGTYRITKSGTYKIMEDITFDFNADYDNPTSSGAWWPHSDQSDDYPGAGGYLDSYFLGFWAGITIEADDVTLDLNNHEIKMSDMFYNQQRWFTGIALQSQYFLPGQGIGFFGADPHFAQNIVIKDGTVGLSSHHGIHGHFNKNVEISNVHVQNFETHGIQFNGFDNVVIKDCEIGPTSSQAYFKGEYGHALTLLPRFQAVANESPNEEIHFYGRDDATTMQEIVDELQKQVDMAYNYVINGVEYDEDDESWQSAKYLFVDDTHLPNGAAMYGIFLNTYGASVLTYNLYTSFYSNDATVSNVKIHGLNHAMNEYIRMSFPMSGNLFMNPLHAPFDATQILETVESFESGQIHYKGSVLTDACLAMSKFSNNWNYLQAQLLMDNKMLKWAQEGGDQKLMDHIQIGCNTDVMIHSGKGISGLRIDGVDTVSISDIEIYDIVEETPLGRDECGEYDAFRGEKEGVAGGHFRQTQPMQIGFSGTMIQGITINAAKSVTMKNVEVRDLESKHGAVYGIAIWPAVDITFEGDIVTKNIQAGTDIEYGTLTYDSRPNLAPEGCGLRIYESYTAYDFEYTAAITNNADSMETNCVSSHVSCFNEEGTFTNLGDYVERDDCPFDMINGESSNDNEVIEEEANHMSPNVSPSESNSDSNVVSYIILAVLGVFVALLAHYGYKCLSKYNLIENKSVNEEYSLISANEEATKYTVL